MFNLFLLAFVFFFNLGVQSTSLPSSPPTQCPVSNIAACPSGTISVQLSTNPSINYIGAGICPPQLKYGCETPPPPGIKSIPPGDNIGGDQCSLPIGGGWSRQLCPIGSYYGIIGSSSVSMGKLGQCKEYRFGCKSLSSSSGTTVTPSQPCPVCSIPRCSPGLISKKVGTSPNRGNCSGCPIYKCERPSSGINGWSNGNVNSINQNNSNINLPSPGKIINPFGTR
ncbi:MAG: hypothetical protein SFU25_08880 [Candidatus Caenarcaniphilales bacterium]|nr:hypothetical protein [Candidatus Caenarcaniphilales bacterium]